MRGDDDEPPASPNALAGPGRNPTFDFLDVMMTDFVMDPFVPMSALFAETPTPQTVQTELFSVGQVSVSAPGFIRLGRSP